MADTGLFVLSLRFPDGIDNTVVNSIIKIKEDKQVLDPAIDAFLTERKLLWLKKRINDQTTVEEKTRINRQADEAFSLNCWLPEATKRAEQLYAVTHPGKFTHPDAKITPVLAQSKKRKDGFLRSGNVDVELDVYGNAASLDVYKFLNIRVQDGQSVLWHLEQQTTFIKQQFNISGVTYESIARGLLAIKKNGSTKMITSGKIKQVYFPIGHDKYHLLSILTPSSLMFKIKERINALRFSQNAHSVQDASLSKRHHNNGLPAQFALYIIGFGGTKPQNISVLNNQNGGTAFLLPSLPPCVQSSAVKPPKSSFFVSYLDLDIYQEAFEQWHQQMVKLKNNNHLEIRKKRDALTRDIIYLVADQLWQVRHLDAGWSQSGSYRKLPQHEKIWLDQLYESARKAKSDYLIKIKQALIKWFANAYTEIIGEQAFYLSGHVLLCIQKQIERSEAALR